MKQSKVLFNRSYWRWVIIFFFGSWVAKQAKRCQPQAWSYNERTGKRTKRVFWSPRKIRRKSSVSLWERKEKSQTLQLILEKDKNEKSRNYIISQKKWNLSSPPNPKEQSSLPKEIFKCLRLQGKKLKLFNSFSNIDSIEFRPWVFRHLPLKMNQKEEIDFGLPISDLHHPLHHLRRIQSQWNSIPREWRRIKKIFNHNLERLCSHQLRFQ